MKEVDTIIFNDPNRIRRDDYLCTVPFMNNISAS